jgi:putative MATE family efflux protein
MKGAVLGCSSCLFFLAVTDAFISNQLLIGRAGRLRRIPIQQRQLSVSSASTSLRVRPPECCTRVRAARISLDAARPSSTDGDDESKTATTLEDEDDDEGSRLAKLKRRLTLEFVNIGGPALIQLAAEPLASLVDTAYLGRLGPHVLGGAGVAVSAQYAVSKLYNDPLLRTSISLVAAQDGAARGGRRGGGGGDGGEGREGDSTAAQQDGTKPAFLSSDDDDGAAAAVDAYENEAKAKLSRAVSSALLLAATVGLVQLGVYSVFCKGIIRAMGLSPSSPMWSSAVGYLQVRAWGTPAATLWLVSNGIFRGLGDTATPLVYSLLFTGLNAVLDPLFIFVWHWGAAGAAAGTALAQYVALVPLLLALHRRVPVDIVGQFRDLGASLREYVQAGSLVLVRSFGKVLAYSVCARQAAVLGSVSAAAYNLTFQLGFATTQICEAVAVAVQTLLARELADKSTHRPAVRSRLIRHLISTSVGIGGAVASILSLSTYWRRHWILKGLTTNASVQAAAASIFPVVLLTQVLKGMAYPVRSPQCGNMLASAVRSPVSVAHFAPSRSSFHAGERDHHGRARLGL